jgi:hypothetical protein
MISGATFSEMLGKDAYVLKRRADGVGDVIAGAEQEEAGPKAAEASVQATEALEEADARDPGARGARGRRCGVRAEVARVEHEHRVESPGLAATPGRFQQRRFVVHAQPLPEPHHRRRRGLHRRTGGTPGGGARNWGVLTVLVWERRMQVV